MKNTLRKLLCTVMAIVMLLSVTGLQSLAAPSLTLPTVTDVEIITDEAVSLKDIGNYYEEIKTMFNNFGNDLSFDDFINFGMFGYSLYDMDISYKATLSNGKTITFGPDSNGYASYNALVDVYVDGKITYSDYTEAAKSGSDTVKITVDATVSYSYIDYPSGNSATFVKEISAVDCHIKSFKAISPLPEYCYWSDGYMQLDGAKFEIIYADGTAKTAAVEQSVDQKYGTVEYTLDGKELTYSYNDETSVTYYLMDESFSTPMEYKDGDIFKSIKITDYTIGEKSDFTDVSYEITWDDGSKKSYTGTLPSDLYYYYIILERVDGFYVYADLLAPDDVPTQTDCNYLTVYVGEVSDCVEVENSNSGNFLSRIVDFIKNIIMKILAIFNG